ncbi:MAG: glucose-1-phosphate adenylyltransferase [Puniceicoccales bacterium]|nr:glucose-1-phosphate adenylyltransferase [Puniceicoccales bacterium]
MSHCSSNVCCIIMGGGRGTRLAPLTQVRCKPAVPLGGKYRLVDISISNCLNSGYNKIYLLTQFNTESLHRHIQESYRFDYFSGGFVEILSAEQTERNDAWYRGTADAVRQNLIHIALKNNSTVIILSGDQLYRMNLQEFVQQHTMTQADITIATKAVPTTQAHKFGIMQVTPDWHIERFVEKPNDPEILQFLQICPVLRARVKDANDQTYCWASMGIYAFKANVLKECLDSEDHDFGHDIIPRALAKYRLCSYFFNDYWEDIGTISSFFEANLMLTDNLPPFDFYNEMAPIYSRPRHLAASKLNSCTVNHSIVAEGCIVTNTNLNRCIIGIRSIIRGGSQLENVYMMGADRYERLDQLSENENNHHPHLGIGKNCYIRNAIIDRNVRIGNNVRLSPESKPDGFHQGPIFIKDGILCIAKDGMIPDNTIL